MVTSNYAEQLISSYGPTLKMDALIFELNKLYHAFEAREYDDIHPEVHEQLPPIWSQMVRALVSNAGTKQWNILDFGCGTGFESTQLLDRLGISQIRSLTCYDPSPEMLALCRSKLEGRTDKIRFCRDLDEVMQAGEEYDILATNSLLHHLPSPAATIRSIEPVLAKEAWWLMGHEPSRRYYNNPECLAQLGRYSRAVKCRKAVSPRACYTRMRRLFKVGDYPAQRTADAAYREGLLEKRPTAEIVSRLVDFNVPHSYEEASAGRGFDFLQMPADLASLWRMRWVKTYAFMGPYTETTLPPKWGAIADQLRAKYPRDGANFCSVWSRL